MNLPKIRASFAAIAAAIAYLVAPSASAAILAQNNFEESRADFVADIGGEDASAITAYDSNYPSTTAPYPFSGSGAEGFGSNYLKVDTGDATIFREFDAQRSSTYLDAYMQFEPTSGEISYTNVAKIVVYLDAATSNLCVISGTNEGTRTPVTNRLDTAAAGSATVVPGTWGRLTVNAIKTPSDNVFKFNVLLNGNTLSVGGTTDTFYSLTDSNAVSRVGFKGTGALDDFVARTSDPFGTAATINGETYGSLADAIAEAGADDVVILQSNNEENITLAEGQTFKLKPGEFTYSGTVTSASGCRLKISAPDANGVVTYSQAPACKPSININFTDSGNGLTTADDVGLAGYEVPGTSWNNFAGANGTYSTVKAVDATGAASTEASVSVVVSGSRGSYSCSGLTAASNPLQGYIDENANNMTPTVTVTGIPYYKYRVLVYHSTDTANVPFGYDTINGTNYTYVNDALDEGTTAWGNSGADNSANAISEGGNVLMTGELFESTLTVVGHRGGGDASARGCIAAIQIVEVPIEVGENDLEIHVSGDTTYTVSEEKTLSGTVYITGSGTLTLDGSAKISAATIEIGANVTLNINANRLDATTFAGAGTVVYNGVAPQTGKGWAAIGWSGTVWIKNYAIAGLAPGDFANARSTLRLSMCTGHFNDGDNTKTCDGTLDLQNDTGAYAFSVDNGWSANGKTIFAKLTGSGTLGVQSRDIAQRYIFKDASEFTGAINLAGRPLRVIFGDGESLTPANGSITVASGATVTVPSDKTWTANVGGFVVDGTLNVNGTIASTHATKAVSGAGTVVFTSRAPTPTGDAWWKNEAWMGTIEIKDATLAQNIHLADYGNTGSKVCMNGSSAYLYATNWPGKHNVGELMIGSNGFTQNGSYSSGTVSFKLPCKITGSGTYTLSAAGNAEKTMFLAGDVSSFSGMLKLGGNNCRFVIGATERAFVASSIVIGSGASFTVGSDWSYANAAGGIFVDAGGTFAVSASGYVDPAGGLTIDGNAKASGKRVAWGCLGANTSILINDTGVLELTSTANINDASYGNYSTSTDLSKITGTGTLKYSSTAGWRAFPDADVKMPASTLTLQIELDDSLIISKNNGATVIGNLAGSKNIRSDFGDNGASGRTLTVTQSKDTEWQGKFVANRITQFNVVAPAEGTPGTLTLSGTQDVSIPMQIDGNVNLTGTWVGAVTVAGTLGGTGTISGNVTLSDGATLKVNDISDLLSVTGLTISGTVNIDLPEGTAFNTNTKFLTTSSKPTIYDGAKFNVSVGGVRKAVKVSATNDGLRLSLAPIVFLL